MRKFVVVIVFCCATPSWATLLLYDGFEYTSGDPLSGKVNPGNGLAWSRAGAATTDTIRIASSGLTPPTGQPANGLAVSITGRGDTASNGAADRLSIGGAITSGTVYYSFTMRVDSLSGSNNAIGGFFAGFNNSVGVQAGNPGTVGARLYGRIDPADGAKYDLGIATNRTVSAGAPPAWSSALNVGDTIFVVGSYEIVTGATNDVSRLWVNPTIGGAAPPATATDTTTGTDLNIASFLLRQADAPFDTVDELRVASTWEDVTSSFTPEPASLLLLAAGTALLSARRRGA